MNIPLIFFIIWTLLLLPAIPVTADEPPPMDEWPVKKQGTGVVDSRLPVERMRPKTILGPNLPQKSEQTDSMTLIRQWLAKGDRILDPNTPPVPGRILASIRGSLTISQGDQILLFYPESLPVGTILDIFRPGPLLHDRQTSEHLGSLLFRLGSVQITRKTPQGLLGVVMTSFVAMQAGDQLDLPRPLNGDFTIHAHAPNPMSGRVVHIQDNQEEAATHMVITVGLGRGNRAVQGLTLPVFRVGRPVSDPVTGETVTTPAQPIGQAILFQIGNKASFALLDKSQMPIHVGDTISTNP
ncbi:MAG: hypothetical protein H7839_02195 [Magnetococcus sp. YQC-5]